MTFLKLGFRSLFRQKRRTTLTLVVITFGVGCLLLTMGHTAFVEWGLKESTIHSETGHLQIFNTAYFENEEDLILEHGLHNHAVIESALNQMLDVQLVQARTNLMGLISNGDKSVAFVGQAVEPEKEKQLRMMFFSSGASFDSLIAYQQEEDCVILGKGLAESLKVEPGDWVTLMTNTADGALNAIDVKVVDTVQSGSSELDKRLVRIPMRTAGMLLNSDKVEKLLVTLDDTEKTEAMYEKITDWARRNNYSITVRRWYEQTRYYHQVRQFFFQITGFISIILFIIVFFSTSNTIMMSIVERTREIGTLLSVGTSRFQTIKMFAFEGLFLGLIGGLLSIAFGYVLSNGINSLNITLPPPPGMLNEYQLSVRTEAVFYIPVFIVTVAVTIVSSLLPAMRVTRMKIVDALGHI